MRLSNTTYEAIKQLVVDFLEDYGIDSYPLDIKALIRKMGVILVAYSDLSDEARRAALECSDDAFRIVSSDYSTATIWFNDSMPKERVNYSLAHEVAHIVLEHSECTEDDPIAESEADFFAAYLLMPVPLVYKLCNPDPYEISEFFGTSISAATNAMNRTKSRLRSKAPVQEYEVRLMDNILAAMQGGGPLG